MQEADLLEKQIAAVISTVRITNLDLPIIIKELTEALIKAGYYLEFNLTESYSYKLGFTEQTTLTLSSETEALPAAHYEFIVDAKTASIWFYRICTQDSKIAEYAIPFDRLELTDGIDVRAPLVKIVSEIGDDEENFWLFTTLVDAVIAMYLERLCNLPAHLLDDDRNPISSKKNVVSIFGNKH